MKKYVKIISIGLAMALILTGCGNQIPDLTEEQARMIGEYAAITLLKYDADHRSRLVDISVIEAHEEKEKRLQEMMAQANIASGAGGMKPVKDTPTVDIGQKPETSGAMTLEEFYGLPAGMTISYQGESISDSYSGDTSIEAFSLDATAGKKLLVLRFAIENQSGSDQDIDLFSKTAVYRVTVNGTYTRGALTTMLMDDMSTFTGSIKAGESRNVVLIVEIEKNMADSVSNILLNFKNESKTGTIQLK